jgi:hypothetical protein
VLDFEKAQAAEKKYNEEGARHKAEGSNGNNQ